jgi:predicted Rossmann-fold nucleotide-binding protein
MKESIAKVGVFGSSRIASDSWLWSQGYQVGLLLASKGFTVVTGGGPGFSEAVVYGTIDGGQRRIVHRDPEDDYPLVGLFGYTPEGKAYVKPKTAAEKETAKYTMLVDSILDVDAYIFLPGGYGTQMEMLTVLHAMQVGDTERKPVCVVGTTHRNALMRFMADGLKQGYLGNDEVFHSFYSFPMNAAEAICKLV